MMRSMKAPPLAALLFAGTAAAQLCPGVSPWVFSDVPASHPFCAYITWMAQRGVTTGCQVIDPGHRLYCPDDPVPRSQMAAFMNRLGDSLFPLTCAPGQVMKWNGAAWTCSDDNIGGSGGGGTVTSVLAGTGLTASPNPIIAAGVINLAPGYQLPQACANGQVAKSNGVGGWTCAADNDTNSGGTVTSVTAGTGLIASPNPITSTGSINLAPAYQLPQACANGQVAKSNGSGGWTCAADNDTNSGGTVTSLTAGTGITLTPSPITSTGTIAVNTTTMQQRVSGSCAVGSSIRAIAADGTVTCETDSTGPTNAFVQGGNAFNATGVLGTTDNFALDVRVNNARVMRYEPNAISPNVVGGNPASIAAAGVRGATIAGGGVPPGGDPEIVGLPASLNTVASHYGTVGGGMANRAGESSASLFDNGWATVAGGMGNTARQQSATVGGGAANQAGGRSSTVAGGNSNAASGDTAAVGGGVFNRAEGNDAVVAGGSNNHATANGAAVAGGSNNWASGSSAMVAGGAGNYASGSYSLAGGHRSEARGDHSIALGRRAKTYSGANNGVGAIVLADGNDFDFNEFNDNRFAVRATGGVYFALAIDAGGGTTSACYVTSGSGGWNCISDRNVKHGLIALDGREVLDKLAAMPIYQWQPKGQNAQVLHYGPMAQDFHAAFGLGDDDTMIGMQDADGVALAAIQGLHGMAKERDAKLVQQESELRALKAEIATLRALIERLLGGAIVPAAQR